MRRLTGLFAAAILLLTATLCWGDSAASKVLTSFDFNIVGVGLKASPDYQAVPKVIASKINADIDAGSFNVADIIAQLPQDYTV